MTRPPIPGEPARVCAARLVARWLDARMQTDVTFPDDRPDRAFVMNLVCGVVRWQRLLSWVAAEFSSGRPSPSLLPHLLCGLYQVLFMDGVADHAAVHETVKAAKAAVGRKAAGYLNAVLRRAVTERAVLKQKMAALPTALKESHPDALVNRWSESFGPARAEALCRWNNVPPETVVHPFLHRVEMPRFLTSLREAGLAVASHPTQPDRFALLPRGVAVERVPGYDAGLFSVQDPATAAAVDLLDARPGQRVLDACAAPGGKTMLIAEGMRDEGVLVAVEVQPARLERLRGNLRRVRFACVQPLAADAADPSFPGRVAQDGLFDRVLLDAPCTNTGVLRRKADARWRFSADRLAQATRLQRRLLDNVAPLVKPGGRLVYSTCSLEREENEGIVAPWLTEHREFRLADSRTSFPPESGTDGAYAAMMEREP